MLKKLTSIAVAIAMVASIGTSVQAATVEKNSRYPIDTVITKNTEFFNTITSGYDDGKCSSSSLVTDSTINLIYSGYTDWGNAYRTVISKNKINMQHKFKIDFKFYSHFGSRYATHNDRFFFNFQNTGTNQVGLWAALNSNGSNNVRVGNSSTSGLKQIEGATFREGVWHNAIIEWNPVTTEMKFSVDGKTEIVNIPDYETVFKLDENDNSVNFYLSGHSSASREDSRNMQVNLNSFETEKVSYNIESKTSGEGAVSVDTPNDKDSKNIVGQASFGEKVTINVRPQSGWRVNKVSVVDNLGNAVKVENNSFNMPSGEVTIRTSFNKVQTILGDTTADANIHVNGAIGFWEDLNDDGASDLIPENPEVNPPSNIANINVAVPVSMAFQVATNAGNEFVTADYNITNNSSSHGVKVSLSEFKANTGNEFNIVANDATLTKGDGQVDMKLDFVYDKGQAGEKTIALTDNYNTEVALGTIVKKDSTSATSRNNVKVMTFNSTDFETGEDEGIEEGLKAGHTLKLKFSL